MPRTEFERELRDLEDGVLILGSMVDRAIERAMHALRTLDREAADVIVKEDLLINRRRFQLEDAAITLIALQQPTARDLRQLVAILSIVVDLERMGDHAEGIAKIALMHPAEPLLKPLIDLPRMADIARAMLRRSLDAFVNRDADEARRVCDEDDSLDALHDQVYRELLLFMLENPRAITRATYLTWVAHNLERIGDRATNIAERVVYLVTGTMEELNVSKY